MANNTILVGFGIHPRKDGSGLNDDIVVLRRWGVQVNVTVPREAVQSIRHACTDELPIKPPQRPRFDDRAVYNEDTGAVQVFLKPDTALFIGELLTGTAVQALQKLGNEMMEAHDQHKQYLDTSNEPGVPQ